MTSLYEGMFLLDNHVVREDWKRAKAAVTNALTKHGAEVLTARRWDERKLAYPIEHRRRATYLLAYYRAPVTADPELRREFDLDERVLRYLLVKAEVVPEGEAELAAREDAADFVPPAPPGDDEPVTEEGAPVVAADVEEPEPDEVEAREDEDEVLSDVVGAAIKKPRRLVPAAKQDEVEEDL